MGRRTNDPHRESFLALGCAIEEHLENDRRALPPSLPVSAFDDWLANVLGGSQTAYLAKQARDFRTGLAIDESVRLLEAGFSVAEIETPFGRRMIERASKLRADLLYSMEQPQRPITSAGEEWRPPRAIVTDVIAGVFFACESARLADAVDVLNRGIPRSGRLQCLTTSEVRNALHGFARPQVANTLAKQRRAEFVAHRAAVLWRIWKRIEATPELERLPKSVAFGTILDDGRLYGWLLEAEETALRPKLTQAHLVRLNRDALHILETVKRRRGENIDAAISSEHADDVSRASAV